MRSMCKENILDCEETKQKIKIKKPTKNERKKKTENTLDTVRQDRLSLQATKSKPVLLMTVALKC